MIFPSPIYEEALDLVKEGYAPFPMHTARKLNDGKTYLCTCGKSGTLGTGSEESICKGKHPVVPFSEWNGTEEFGPRWESYGIGIHVGKSHCWVLDIDGADGFSELKDLTDKNGKLPETRCVKTGGGGQHYYFAAWVDKVCSGFITKNIHVKGNVGNSYVVAPPSKHHSGNKYEYINRTSPVDAPEWLLKLVKDRTIYTGEPLSEAQLIKRSGYEIPIYTILSKEIKKSIHQEGKLIRGSHPIHGSTTGRNFTIDTVTNRWFCNRHGSYGGLFELAAILGGICKCEEFVRSDDPITIPALQGKKFAESVQYCLDSGINPEDLKFHISRGKYERR